MIDTSEEMHNKQLEIIYSKSPIERFILGAKMIDDGRMMVENSIKGENPGITKSNLKILTFRRYYENYFDQEELTDIINSIKLYNSRKSD